MPSARLWPAHVLEPGYSYGAVLVGDDCELAAGSYEVEVSYTNRDHRGPDGKAIGELSHATKLPLRVP